MKSRLELEHDLEFIKFYKMICGLMVEYHDEFEFTFSKEEAQERVDGCELVIEKITKELEGYA